MTTTHRTTPPGALRAEPGGEIRLTSSVTTTQTVIFTRDLLALDNALLASLVGTTPSLFVTTPTVARLYGPALREYLATHLPDAAHRVQVIDCRENTKTMDSVLSICHAASEMKLGRTARIIGVGGGVCTDVAGFAAAIYGRGVAHIKIPTTFIGLIDAGIATKNAVNFVDRKSSIGTFNSPEYSVLDPTFVHSLDRRHVRSGMGECLKIALVCDRALFEVLERDGPVIIESALASPAESVDHVVRASVLGMLEELSENLFEIDAFQRAVNFGHTLSPYIEAATGYTILHGEAVAIDMAISVTIAQRLGVMSAPEAERALETMGRLGMLEGWPDIDAAALWSSLEFVRAHRGGRLHLVVPTTIGSHAFLDDLSAIGVDGLADVLAELGEANANDRRDPVGA